MKYIICFLLIWNLIDTGSAQDIVYSDSLNYNEIIQLWQNSTYGKISQVIQGSNDYTPEIKQETSSPESQGRISPIEALDSYVWKDKKGELLYDPNTQELPPSWLVKGYLKKHSFLLNGFKSRKLKNARCYKSNSKKSTEVAIFPNTSQSPPVFNNFYLRNYKSYLSSCIGPAGNSAFSTAGMVPIRNGLMITDPCPLNLYFY